MMLWVYIYKQNERLLIPSFSILKFCRFRLEDEKPKRLLSYPMGTPMALQR